MFEYLLEKIVILVFIRKYWYGNKLVFIIVFRFRKIYIYINMGKYYRWNFIIKKVMKNLVIVYVFYVLLIGL